MRKKTKTTDTGGTNGIVNETDKQKYNSSLTEKVEIENTPFTAIRVEDKWFLTLGKYRLTPPTNSKDEILAASLDESWWRIMQVIQIMIDEHELKKGKEPNGTKLTGEISTRKLK